MNVLRFLYQLKEIQVSDEIIRGRVEELEVMELLSCFLTGDRHHLTVLPDIGEIEVMIAEELHDRLVDDDEIKEIVSNIILHSQMESMRLWAFRAYTNMQDWELCKIAFDCLDMYLEHVPLEELAEVAHDRHGGWVKVADAMADGPVWDFISPDEEVRLAELLVQSVGQA